MSPPMAPLIPVFDPGSAPKSVTDFMALIPVDRVVTHVLANSPTFFQPVMQLTSACWAPTRSVRSSEWQTCVLRTAALLGCPYEQQVNEPLGSFFGFDDEALQLLRAGDLSDRARFSDRHRLVSQMTEELVQHHRLLFKTTARSIETFGSEGTIEIIVIHNVYALVAHVMRTAEVEEDPPIPGVVETLRNFNGKAIELELRQREEDKRSQQGSRRFRARAAAEAVNGSLATIESKLEITKPAGLSDPRPSEDGGAEKTASLGYSLAGLFPSAMKFDESPISAPGEGEVQVQWLYASVNPQDILVVEGKYPAEPTYRNSSGGLIPGYDGVGRVTSRSNGQLQPGTLVVPAAPGLGTWRTTASLPASSLVSLEVDSPSPALSMLRMTYLPAFLMLEKHRLYPSDWVILNAGTSSIAQAACSIARSRGVKVALIIRDRPDTNAVVASLTAIGAAVVLTESEMSSAGSDGPEQLRGKHVALGLDAVYGSSGENLLRVLAPDGTFVNYGTLGGGGPAAEMPVRSKDLFWKGIKFERFRSSEEISRLGEERTRNLLRWLASEITRGSLEQVKVERVAWNSDVLSSLARNGDQKGLSKRVLDFGAEK